MNVTKCDKCNKISQEIQKLSESKKNFFGECRHFKGKESSWGWKQSKGDESMKGLGSKRT